MLVGDGVTCWHGRVLCSVDVDSWERLCEEWKVAGKPQVRESGARCSICVFLLVFEVHLGVSSRKVVSLVCRYRRKVTGFLLLVVRR